MVFVDTQYSSIQEFQSVMNVHTWTTLIKVFTSNISIGNKSPIGHK